MRLCFAVPTHDEIRQGIAVLAEVCHKEFGVPARIANVERAGAEGKARSARRVLLGPSCREGGHPVITNSVGDYWIIRLRG